MAITVKSSIPIAIIRLIAVCRRVCRLTSPVVIPALFSARRKVCATPLTV